jgi:protein-S-isoprenylcysteine O-methyltransferase Ste14
LLVVQILRVQQESRVLEAKFGEEYREYRQRTWF